MHIVVNHIALQDGVDWPHLEAEVEAFNAHMQRTHPDCLGVALVRESGAHAIFLVHFADLEALQRLSSEVAAPWFAEHVKPLLAGPVDRHVGEVVAGELH